MQFEFENAQFLFEMPTKTIDFIQFFGWSLLIRSFSNIVHIFVFRLFWLKTLIQHLKKGSAKHNFPKKTQKNSVLAIPKLRRFGNINFYWTYCYYFLIKKIKILDSGFSSLSQRWYRKNKGKSAVKNQIQTDTLIIIPFLFSTLEQQVDARLLHTIFLANLSPARRPPLPGPKNRQGRDWTLYIRPARIFWWKWHKLLKKYK